MNQLSAELQKQVDETVKRFKSGTADNPNTHIVKLCSYSTEDALQIEGDPHITLQEHQAMIQALGGALHEAGAGVYLQHFDPVKYSLWRGRRKDTRQLRAEWLAEEPYTTWGLIFGKKRMAEAVYQIRGKSE